MTQLQDSEKDATAAAPPQQSFFDNIGKVFGSKTFTDIMAEFATKGLSIKTYEPIVNNAVKLAVQYFDGLDDPNGKADGLLHREVIVQKIIEQFDAQMANPKNRYTPEQRAKFQANRGQLIQKLSEKLPEAFSINDKGAEALVHSTLQRIDTNNDGRVNLSEVMASKKLLDPEAIFSLVTPVTPAVPSSPGASVRIPG